MGFKEFMERRAEEYRQAQEDFEVGCTILGPPSNPNSVMQRKARVDAGRRARERRQRGD
ncbi:hypothetical protein JOF56_004307 [Kibdelosporangium banguiense]|uniref:Uncharacterized protein n=1 Tax=Kibdelosporangium banguiense TaxID=1365924 RepID=A0ABS4THK9_9PSEU|nr:hypothetical protein [Kibdelosporangium banguiense]MBP2323922.1 hypothetical protein [Kibdelosporangium banguiense]